MAETPRTDAAKTLPATYPSDATQEWWVQADFARTLETELSTLRETAERLREVLGEARETIAKWAKEAARVQAMHEEAGHPISARYQAGRIEAFWRALDVLSAALAQTQPQP